MNNKNQAYQVVDADQSTYDMELNSLHDENGIIDSHDGFWDLDEVKTIISKLPLMQQFKLYEAINKGVKFFGYPMNTVFNCLMDYSEAESLDKVDTDTMQDFNSEFYINYLEDSIDDLKYWSNSFDIGDLLEWLQNNAKNFNYCTICGYNQGEECYLFNDEGLTYDNETIKNFYTCVLYGGLVEIDSLDKDDGGVECLETLSNDYSLEYNRDKIIAYMKKYYNALPAKEVVTRKIVLA